jgi:hypothetical protein
MDYMALTDATLEINVWPFTTAILLCSIRGSVMPRRKLHVRRSDLRLVSDALGIQTVSSSIIVYTAADAGQDRQYITGADCSYAVLHV